MTAGTFLAGTFDVSVLAIEGGIFEVRPRLITEINYRLRAGSSRCGRDHNSHRISATSTDGGGRFFFYR
jgi:hypothetical protein